MRRAALALLLLAGCGWKQQPKFVLPLPYGHYEAVAIAGETYGINFLPEKPPRLVTYYLTSTCADQWGRSKHGYVTHKGNCSCGSVTPAMTQINVAWAPGMTLAKSCFCEAAYQAWEVAAYGMPDNYHTSARWVSGQAQAQIARCRMALLERGL